MKFHNEVRQQLIQKVQEEFNRAYPYLKVEFGRTSHPPAIGMETMLQHTDEQVRESARDILNKDARMSDNLKVSDLETALGHLFGTTTQVYRKSGNFWLETRMTRDWTLKQQNDHGRDIAYLL
jgi:hypothetical protein